MGIFGRRFIRLLACAALFSTGGCMTHALWTGELASSLHEPSTPDNLALFEAPKRHDILVQYDELSPWSDSPRRRAYYLRKNISRIEARKEPKFVNPAIASHLSPIPLRYEPLWMTNQWATFTTASVSNHWFTVASAHEPVEGPFPLPNYTGATGNLKLVALTPCTVTIDGSIVGSVLAFFYWEYRSGAPLGWPQESR
jgi:hypothetical protein